LTVQEFAHKNKYKILCSNRAAEETSIEGVYTCDLLSHAMAKVNDGDMWITVHTNINIVAVAHLTNASCIVVPENINVDIVTLKKAEEQGVIVVSASHSAYEICTRFFIQSDGALS
jgi:hypothetical protein